MTHSDAAKAWADDQFRFAAPIFGSNVARDYAAAAFDAGHAAALATVTPAPTPRTITTPAELDALPTHTILADNGGWPVWHHPNLGWCAGNGTHCIDPEDLIADGAPLTLLVPATAAPQPERLTDPDDPRIKPGARVRRVAEWTLTDGPGWGIDEFSVVTARADIRKATDNESYFLLAEAPGPDAARVELLAAYLHDRGGCEDAWPKCTVSTLENYRDAARNLLAELDKAQS